MNPQPCDRSIGARKSLCGGAHRTHHHARARGRLQGFLQRWLLANSLIAGVFALCWLLLRSGSKPSRFAYPCQQAAVSAATLAFGAPLGGALIAARRRVVAGLRTRTGTRLAALGLLVTVGTWGYASRAGDYRGPRVDPPRDYRAQVFRVTDCPPDPIGDRFVGLDNLLALMGREGLKFYRSSAESLTAGPAGIIAADDVVIIKINYQWPERGGTNVDVLRGLVRRIVDHPDTFSGEIIVCENAQFRSIDGFDRADNNAQDTSLSPHDVVGAFQGQGHSVSHYDWTSVRFNSVGEYSEGDMTDGYVIYPYDAPLHGRVSYPKFQTSDGTYVSLKYGIWSPTSESYDRGRLKIINVPVLKSHGAVYGATVCVKHYMGVVTGELGTNSHSAIAYGILGALLGEIQPADLNILDAVWINADPNGGPWTDYADATRVDQLVASVDPVAADIWAVKNILIPTFIVNGFSPPWPEPSADPDDPTSDFRVYLDNSMSYILAAGHDVTNDLSRIDAATWSGKGDDDGDSDVDLADYGALQICYGPLAAGCEALDFDSDGDVDFKDYIQFDDAFTGPGTF